LYKAPESKLDKEGQQTNGASRAISRTLPRLHQSRNMHGSSRNWLKKSGCTHGSKSRGHRKKQPDETNQDVQGRTTSLKPKPKTNLWVGIKQKRARRRVLICTLAAQKGLFN
jgi:hypothetical protein